MNKLFNKLMIMLVLASFFSIQQAAGQCEISDLPFEEGEKLNYDLYIKLGLVTTKGGYATLVTKSTTYKAQSAYKMDLISATEGVARKLFTLNDTLTSYTTKQLKPLAYIKNAHEGGDYTKENLTYSYSGANSIKIQSKRYKNGDFKFDESITAANCTYDLVSVLYYCRTLDFSNMKNGDQTVVSFISGKRKGEMRIIYSGKEKTKANDGKRYNTHKLVLKIADDAFENGKEAMKVFISDDKNRIPIMLETKLKVGSTKAMLKGYSGTKHDMNLAE